MQGPRTGVEYVRHVGRANNRPRSVTPSPISPPTKFAFRGSLWEIWNLKS